MKLKAVLFSLLMCVAVAGSAGEVDFSSFPQRQYWAAGGTASVSGQLDALLLKWSTKLRRFMEFSFPRPVPLGTFEKITFTVDLKRTPQSTLNLLSLRLLDNDGEIFQFRQQVGGETSQLTYEIDSADLKHSGCWKSSAKAIANKKLDFPVSLLGMSVDYPPNSGDGEVTITSISYRKFPEEPEPVSIRESVPVSGEKFTKKNENDTLSFEYAPGVNFPALRAGQFRLRLKSASQPQAKLHLLHGQQTKPQSPQTVNAENDGIYSLIYPVPYELDGSAVSLKKITVESGSPVEMADLTYEIPRIKLEPDFGNGSVCNVWQKGIPGGVKLSTPGSEEISGIANLILSDASGKILHRIHEKITLAPGETKFFALPEPEKFALYTLTGTIPGKEGRPVAFSCRIGFMPQNNPPPEHDGMQYGVALLTPAIPRQEISALAARLAGADFDRSSIVWAWIERQPGKWDWSYQDAHSKILKKNNLRWAPILWATPRWAMAKNWKPSYTPIMTNFGWPLPDFEHWENYVRKCVERYGKENIRVMEIWNEAELPGFANFSPEEYAEMLKRSYDVIKSVNPSIKVSICGFTCMPGQHPHMTYPDFMPRSLKAAKGKYDVHPIHYHGFFHEYVSGITSFLQARKEWGITVPWAANETAMSSSFCSRQVQAELLFEKMVYSQAKGAVAHVWHNMYDLGRDQFNKEHNFGLLDHALEPKEAYLAYNNLTRLFRSARLVRDLTFDSCFLFLFRRGDKILLPNWTYYPPAAERLIQLSGITGKAYTEDIFGNTSPVKVIDGKLLLHVSSTPKTLVIEQKTLPVMEKEVFRDGKGFGDFSLNPAIQVNSVTGQLEEGEIRKIQVSGHRFHWPLDPKNIRKPQALTLTFDTAWGKFPVRRFLTPLFLFPANADFNRPADFSLQDGSSFMQTSPNDPQYADVMWKGAEDCSVKLWLGWKNPDTIAAKVVVRDDIHFQNDSGIRIYQGDGLQIFFSQTATGGMWKLGIARDNSGKILKYCWIKPGKYSAESVLPLVKAQIDRRENSKETVYDLEFPAKALGITKGKSFRFNLLVNDNDGRCRVGYHSLTEILDDGRNDTGYPLVNFK